MKLARLALQRHLLHADPRERQRERIDNRLQGGRLGGRDAPKAPGGALVPVRVGPAGAPLGGGRGTEHDRDPALTQTLRAEKGGKSHEMSAHPAYLGAGSTLEKARAMAAHESPRTTKLHDRTSDAITLDE